LKKEDFAAFSYFLSQLTGAKHVGELYGTDIKKITKKTTRSAAPVKSKYDRDNLKFLDSCLQDRR